MEKKDIKAELAKALRDQVSIMIKKEANGNAILAAKEHKKAGPNVDTTGQGTSVPSAGMETIAKGVLPGTPTVPGTPADSTLAMAEACPGCGGAGKKFKLGKGEYSICKACSMGYTKKGDKNEIDDPMCKVTPPDISEETAHKIKDEYKGDKSKAYATMWAMHNKNKKTKKAETVIDIAHAADPSKRDKDLNPDEGTVPGKDIKEIPAPGSGGMSKSWLKDTIGKFRAKKPTTVAHANKDMGTAVSLTGITTGLPAHPGIPEKAHQDMKTATSIASNPTAFPQGVAVKAPHVTKGVEPLSTKDQAFVDRIKAKLSAENAAIASGKMKIPMGDNDPGIVKQFQSILDKENSQSTKAPKIPGRKIGRAHV